MIVELAETFEPSTLIEIKKFADDDLINYALATVLIEVPIFYFCGFRRMKDAIFFAAVNIVSNLLLNEFLQTADSTWTIIFVGEIFVIALEFVLCSYWIETRLKLLKTLILTNVSSFLIGLIYLLNI